MKIKQDFVTNSSSTSYIAYIPDNFDIMKFRDMIPEICEDVYEESLESGWYDEGKWTTKVHTKDFVLDRLVKEFKEFMDSGVTYEYDNPSYYMICKLLDELELLVDEENTSSENGSISNVNSKRIKEKISSIKSGGWGIKFGGWGYESKD